MNNRLRRGRLTAGGVVSVVSLLVVVGCSSDDQAPGAASTSSVGGDPQSIDPVQTDAPTTTAAPVLVFGGVDNDEFTFAGDDDLDASVTALRDRYPEFASTPIAVPSDPPPDTSVKLLGYLSWDGKPQVVTLVAVGRTDVFSVTNVEPSESCEDRRAGPWQIEVVRGDAGACVRAGEGRAIQQGDWQEAGATFEYRITAGTVDFDWVASLRILTA